MLYTEFIEGTGCKNNEKNFKVYKNLEIMYMNSNMSKQEIYEYGKKLVDNRKTEKELQIEAEIKAEIDGYKKQIEGNKYWVEYYTEMMVLSKEDGDKEMACHYRRLIKNYRDDNRKLRNIIRFLRSA